MREFAEFSQNGGINGKNEYINDSRSGADRTDDISVSSCTDNRDCRQGHQRVYKA